MSENIFLKTKQDLSERDILRVEEKYNICLPEEYKAYLLQYNGGYPERPCFASVEDKYEQAYSPFSSCIHYFYAIHEERYSNFETSYEIFLGRMPKHIIPIAYDPGGNQVCISIGKQDHGFIYFWDHEKEAPKNKAPDYGNLTLLAKSLRVFINGLYPDK
jgi:hypothetical protein